MAITFKVNPDAAPEVQYAVQTGQLTHQQAYEMGEATPIWNLRQQQFRQSPVFSQEHHENLLFNIDFILDQTRVGIGAMCTSCTGRVSQTEIQQVVNYYHEPRGLIYQNDIPDVYNRMELLAAAQVRQHRDARIYTMDEVINYLYEGEVPPGKILVIPDFYPTSIEDKASDPYFRRKINLFSFLMRLKGENRRAYLFIGNMGTFTGIHGHQIEAYMANNFLPVTREVAHNGN